MIRNLPTFTYQTSFWFSFWFLSRVFVTLLKSYLFFFFLSCFLGAAKCMIGVIPQLHVWDWSGIYLTLFLSNGNAMVVLHIAVSLLYYSENNPKYQWEKWQLQFILIIGFMGYSLGKLAVAKNWSYEISTVCVHAWKIFTRCDFLWASGIWSLWLLDNQILCCKKPLTKHHHKNCICKSFWDRALQLFSFVYPK